MEIWVRLYSHINCCICVKKGKGLLFFAWKGKPTSFWASAGRWEFGRVRLPLPARTGRMGKGILDQDEPFPPAFRSGQLLPVKQRKGRKYEDKKGQKIMLHHVCDQIHSIQTRETRRGTTNGTISTPNSMFYSRNLTKTSLSNICTDKHWMV